MQTRIVERTIAVPEGTFDIVDTSEVDQESFWRTGGASFKPVPVEEPGGGRIRNKQDPARDDMVTVEGYRGRPVPLHRLAASAWRSMLAAARAAGIGAPMLLPVSGYRSTARQRKLFAAAVKKYGSESKARRWVARPGGSAHHSGRAIDLYLGYGISSRNVGQMRRTAAWQWLRDNAERFGFYPYEAEPWHWEYNPPAAGASSTGGTIGNTVGTIRRLPTLLGSAISHGSELAKVAAAIAGGNRDENSLASDLFYARHPERNRRKIDRSERDAIAEWLRIRDDIVRPMLAQHAVKSGISRRRPGASTRRSADHSASDILFGTGGWGGWRGLSSSSVARIRPGDVTDQLGIAVAVTSNIEGAFDKVQTYDRGILSWGIKQWTLHAGSLQKLLGFIQQRLVARGRVDLWTKLFPGISIRNGNTLWYKGVPYDSQSKLRKLVRNSTSETTYDPVHMKTWMRIFVMAGRDPVIQELQLEYAKSELGAALKRRPLERYTRPNGKKGFRVMRGARRTIDYLGNDRRSIALFQSMYTQLPAWALTYVGNVVKTLTAKYGPESRWPDSWQIEFRRTFEDEFRHSGVACWGLRAKQSKPQCRRKNRKTRYQKTIEAYARFTGS